MYANKAIDPRGFYQKAVDEQVSKEKSRKTCKAPPDGLEYYLSDFLRQ